MPPKTRDTRPVTADIGWRVSRLRKRRGLSQNEIAYRTGKHTSFISRVERPASRHGVPKRETIEAILDALDATPEERAAVFQQEPPPPTRDEIDRRLEAVKARYEDNDLMVVLLDAHWYRWYMNARMRNMLGLTSAEYRRTVGEHILLHPIDPSSPMYSRFPDGERYLQFSRRSAAFQFMFAEHEFDRWYLDVVEQVSRFPRAEQYWHALPDKPAFADYQAMVLQHPDGTRLNLTAQMRQMLEAPRFTLLVVSPSDETTARAVDRLAGPRRHRSER